MCPGGYGIRPYVCVTALVVCASFVVIAAVPTRTPSTGIGGRP